MANARVNGRVEQKTLEMTIIRADGTRVPLGTVGYWHRNPLRRWAFRLRKKLEHLKRSMVRT